METKHSVFLDTRVAADELGIRSKSARGKTYPVIDENLWTCCDIFLCIVRLKTEIIRLISPHCSSLFPFSAVLLGRVSDWRFLSWEIFSVVIMHSHPHNQPHTVHLVHSIFIRRI